MSQGARPRVMIVGGGLAGLAAAVALAELDCQVELFESRRGLGGRAASFRDPATGELVDHCQHVSMGCCTNLADFCRRTGTRECFRRHRDLHVIGPDAREHVMSPSRWLPAPLHLVRGFWSLKYLSPRDRLAIGRAVWRLMRDEPAKYGDSVTMGQWLASKRQSRQAIEGFWSLILTSALGESLDRASLAAARKVIVDGFLGSTEASIVEVPDAPLGELYGKRLENWLTEHGVTLRLSDAVRRVSREGSGVAVQADSGAHAADFVVLAVPWSKLSELVAVEIAAAWPWLSEMGAVEAAPITGVHLWFDRPINDLSQVALIGRTGQWVFKHGSSSTTTAEHEHYYQVVISASHGLAGRDRTELVDEVCRELAAIWPAAASAKRLRARVVTDQFAVFSPRPGIDLLRPAQQTPTAGILVAGDWTRTGWPATMESAVRSGYLAAEAIANATGRPRSFLARDLPRGLLARMLIKSK
jgi:squalene-associated FAD-dependent desaturase